MLERDIEIMARTIYGEARGEADIGKLAVAWVIKNRAKKYDVDIGAACLLSIHFSAWNNGRDNDANQLTMLMVNLGDKTYSRCMVAALQAAHGLEADPTLGATHYHTEAVAPSWATGKPYVTIGRHRFYSGIA